MLDLILWNCQFPKWFFKYLDICYLWNNICNAVRPGCSITRSSPAAKSSNSCVWLWGYVPKCPNRPGIFLFGSSLSDWFCFKIANLFLLSLLYSSSFDDHSRHVYILYYNLQYILYLISSSSSIFVFLSGSENKTWKCPSCRLSWIPHCPRVGRVIPSVWLFNNPSERWRSWDEWIMVRQEPFYLQ